MQFFRSKKSEPKAIPPSAARYQDLLDLDHLPRHVAIIMDGNGRWAKARGIPRALGHRAGVEALRGVITTSGELYIEALTVFAFSTENWSRSREEVSALMGLLVEAFEREIDELCEKGVCIRILGDIDGLPDAQREAVRKAEERTKDNTGLRLNLAINYGSRAEIARAARSLAQEVAEGRLDPSQIDETAISDRLYTHGLPDVDLLIRTSGEMRISNFLLYQLWYAEFVVVDTLWPDFDAAAYVDALRTYQSRQRRFGGR